MTEKPFLTTREVAEITGWSVKHVVKLCSRGAIKAHQFRGAGKWFINREAFFAAFQSPGDDQQPVERVPLVQTRIRPDRSNLFAEIRRQNRAVG